MAAELESRQFDILRAVVSEYVKTALPVGSVTLAEKYGFDLSPATIRNELSALEESGLIEQPHTSAGRVPTERGYRVFITNALRRVPTAAGTLPKLRRAADDPEMAVKSVVKQVAERARAAALVAFAPRHVYYTGLSFLFGQPEFQEFGRVARFSEVIDRLDEIVGEVFTRVADEPAVWIGRENPFGRQCGTVIVRCPVDSKKFGVLGILGPMRMDYERCYGLVDLTRRLLTETFG